jgi:hypothetical protein
MKTKVCFRKYSNGDVCAVFPNDFHNQHAVLVFDRDSGHGSAGFGYIYDLTKPASPSEYEMTKRCLVENYGYDLQILSRMPPVQSVLNARNDYFFSQKGK